MFAGVTEPHRLGHADGYSFPLMNHGGYAGHSCTIFSMVQNWPCGVLFFIFQKWGQTVTLCYGNRAHDGHARHRRRGANTRAKHPINLETGSLGVPLPSKLHRRVNLKPTPHTAASEPLWQETGIFTERRAGRHCRRVPTGQVSPWSKDLRR